MEIKETLINENLTLREYSGGLLYGTDALLVAGFCGMGKSRVGIDLGSGSGVISLLLLSRGNAKKMYGAEIQPCYAELSAQNAELNGLDFTPVCKNVAEISNALPCGFADFAVSNPPYLGENCGKKNIDERKFIARHEIGCSINDFCRAAAWCLKSGGKFYVVYRPERTAELLYAMENAGVKPKKLTAVQPSADEPPSLVLVEGKKDAADGLKFTKPIYIYTSSSHSEYTDEMKQICRYS